MAVYRRSALIGCLLLIQAAAASAGTVSIESGPSNSTVVVTADAATKDEILNTLAERTPFDLERVGDITFARTITHTYTGTTRQIVDQILNNESYVVLTSAPTGNISQVVLYGRQTTTQGSPQAPAIAVAPRASAAAPLPPATAPAPIAAAPIPAPALPAAALAQPPSRQASAQSRRTIATPTSLTPRPRN